MPTAIRLFLILEFFAVLLLLGGVYAFTQAPADANRGTALIIPGTASVLVSLTAVLCLLGQRQPRLVRMGWTAALILCVALAGLFAMPANARGNQLKNFPAASAAWTEHRATLGEAEPSRDVRRAFFRERQSPDHDTTYLVRTLWGLTILSGIMAVVLLVLRPASEGRARAGESA